MDKIKIFITDDHCVVRQGLKAMLKSVPGFTVVGEAENGKEAIEQIKALLPDIAVMDISMPVMNGIEATRILKKEMPAVRTLVLTMHIEEEFVEQIYRSGASGCVYKNAPRAEFELAVRALAKGETYFCSQASEVLIKDHFQKKGIETENAQFSAKYLLTKREEEILKLIVSDFSNQDIANRLFISVRTVETHRRNIMHKLNVDSTIGLMRYIIRHKLIPVNSSESRDN
jgi:DNA-binding NarL/FixJ family response regulator